MAGRQIVVEFLGEDRSLSSTARRVEGTTGKLGGKLSKVGLIAGGVLAAGIGAGALAMVSMVKAAAEDEQSQKRLATALKNTTGASATQVAGVEKWISAQGKALGVTDDQLRPAFQKLVTATGDVGKAQKLSSLAMDASAGTGKSLESVSTALAKAQNGNVGALAKLGIATKDASGKALSFEQIQKNMAKTFGGQAAGAANTFQGKMDRLKLVFDETKEAIGAKLIPVVTKLAGWFLDKALPAMSAFGKYMQTKLGPVFSLVGGLLSKLGKGGEENSGKFTKMLASIKSILSSLGSIIKSVVSIVTSLWKRFGDDILSYATSTFQNIIKVVDGALKVVSGIFKLVAALLKGDWAGAWNAIKQIVAGAWQVITGLVSQGWNVIKTVFSIGASAVAGIFGGLWSGAKSIVSSGITAIVNLVKGIPGKIGAVGSAMASAGKALMQKLLDGISSAAGFVKGFATGVWDAVRALVNAGIDKLNAALDFNITILGKTIRINAPNVPHLYQGGIVSGSKYGTPIVAGDRGHAEAVIPLDGPHAPSFGGGDIHLTIELDSEVVHRSLVRRKRTLGRELGLA